MHIVICQENELKMHETTARIQGTRQRGALRHVERAPSGSHLLVVGRRRHGMMAPCRRGALEG